jgi:hypothetical protein
VKPLSGEFPNYWVNRIGQIDEMPDSDKPDLYDIVDKFQRKSLVPSESKIKIAFATFKGKQSEVSVSTNTDDSSKASFHHSTQRHPKPKGE